MSLSLSVECLHQLDLVSFVLSIGFTKHTLTPNAHCVSIGCECVTHFIYYKCVIILEKLKTK